MQHSLDHVANNAGVAEPYALIYTPRSAEHELGKARVARMQRAGARAQDPVREIVALSPEITPMKEPQLSMGMTRNSIIQEREDVLAKSMQRIKESTDDSTNTSPISSLSAPFSPEWTSLMPSEPLPGSEVTIQQGSVQKESSSRERKQGVVWSHRAQEPLKQIQDPQCQEPNRVQKQNVKSWTEGQETDSAHEQGVVIQVSLSSREQELLVQELERVQEQLRDQSQVRNLSSIAQKVQRVQEQLRDQNQVRNFSSIAQELLSLSTELSAERHQAEAELQQLNKRGCSKVSLPSWSTSETRPVAAATPRGTIEYRRGTEAACVNMSEGSRQAGDSLNSEAYTAYRKWTQATCVSASEGHRWTGESTNSEATSVNTCGGHAWAGESLVAEAKRRLEPSNTVAGVDLLISQDKRPLGPIKKKEGKDSPGRHTSGCMEKDIVMSASQTDNNKADVLSRQLDVASASQGDNNNKIDDSQEQYTMSSESAMNEYTWTIHSCFTEGVKELECRVDWDQSVPTVACIVPRGPAEVCGIRTGDCIVQINGMETGGQSREQLLPILQQRPLTLKLKRKACRTTGTMRSSASNVTLGVTGDPSCVSGLQHLVLDCIGGSYLQRAIPAIM